MKISTTYVTLAGDELAPALAIKEFADGDIIALIVTENADIRLRLRPAAFPERSRLKQGEYIHPSQLIDDVTPTLHAAAAAVAAASTALEGIPDTAEAEA